MAVRYQQPQSGPLALDRRYTGLAGAGLLRSSGVLSYAYNGSSSSVVGPRGRALRFAATGNGDSFTHNLGAVSDFTLIAVMDFAALGATNSIIDCDLASLRCFQFRKDTNNTLGLIRFSNGSPYFANTTTAVAAVDTPVVAIARSSGAAMDIWLNGGGRGSGTISGTPAGLQSTIFTGASAGSASNTVAPYNLLNGNLYMWAVLPYALTDAEVAAVSANPWRIFASSQPVLKASAVAGTHAATGALTGSSATIAGTATHSGTHAATGALTGQSATIAGTATHNGNHPATGALAASSAAVAGTAARTAVHAASGALAASAATIAGTAVHSAAGTHVASGALAAGSASLAGAALHTPNHQASGALAGSTATIAGTAAHTSAHPATGALAGQAATLAGTAARTTVHAATGVLAAQAAALAGTAARAAAAAVTHAATGALAGSSAKIAGATGALAGSATPLTPVVQVGKTLLTANTAKDGTGPVVTLYTAGSNGSKVDGVQVDYTGTSVATVLRLFVNNGLTPTVAANNTLFKSISVPANTLSETAAALDFYTQMIGSGSLMLPAGYNILATIGTTIAAAIAVTATGGDL